VLCAVDVEEHFAVEDVERLVARIAVQRGVSIRREITPTAALTWGPEAEAGILKMVIIGVIRKMNGNTAIVPITNRLRRNSRTSLRTTETMRLRLTIRPRCRRS
jgi:hypothetical protein